jgi:hypothetical protein
MVNFKLDHYGEQDILAARAGRLLHLTVLRLAFFQPKLEDLGAHVAPPAL